MKNKQLIWLCKGAVSLGLLFYLITILDWEKVSELKPLAGVVLIAGSFGVLFLLVFMALRWITLVRMQTSTGFGFSEAYQGYLISLFFGIFLPGGIGGDLIRIKYCTERCKIGLRTSTFIIVTERFFGVTALALFFSAGLALGGARLFGGRVGNSDTIIIVSALAVAILSACFLWRKVALNPLVAAKTLLLSIMAQGIDLLVAFMFLLYFCPDARIFWILIVMPLAFVATILPISLGGLGVREGVISSVLVLFNVDPSSAILFSFMVYLSKVIVGIIGGALLLRGKFNVGQGVAWGR